MRRQRRALRVALVASLLVHLAVLVVLVWLLPPVPPRPVQHPVSFTLVEHPASPKQKAKPVPRPLAASTPGRRGSASSGPTGGLAPSGPQGQVAVPDVPCLTGSPAWPCQNVPLAKTPTPPMSFQEASERAAADVVKQRGPKHPPGDSVGERLTETLKRGTGAMAVQRSGFWDAYFTLLRKALLKAWSGEQALARFDRKATARVRLVLDADGLLRDFDIVLSSGSPAMDKEVEQSLHQTTQFPPPPDYVMHGKDELVTEWELTVHPQLALSQGMPSFSPFGPSIVFDVVTLANPAVDLTPLKVNVTLASYWTR